MSDLARAANAIAQSRGAPPLILSRPGAPPPAHWARRLIWLHRRGAGATLVALLLTLLFPVRAQTPGAPAAEPSARLATTKPSIMSYSVQPPLNLSLSPRVESAPWARQGWGLFATVRGRSVDLTSPGGWADDPGAGANRIEAGLAWRGRDVSATMGYVEPDFGRRDSYHPNRPHPSGLVGLTITLRPH